MTEPQAHIFPASYAQLVRMERTARIVGNADVAKMLAAVGTNWNARTPGQNRFGVVFVLPGRGALIRELLPPGAIQPSWEEWEGMMCCASAGFIPPWRSVVGIDDVARATCTCGLEHLIFECRIPPSGSEHLYLRRRVLLCTNGPVRLEEVSSDTFLSYRQMAPHDSYVPGGIESASASLR